MNVFPTYATLIFDGFSEDFEKSIMRTEFDSGLPRQAPTKSRAMHFRTLTYNLCSKTDYLSFLNWYDNDLGRGAYWFLWLDPVSGKNLRARIFEGDIKAVPLEKTLNKWNVTFRLETWSNF